MAIEIDHIFICTSINAPEAEHLVSFGLVEGSSKIHPGQGTANRRFFFKNIMLELLWVYDPIECQSQAIGPTHLWERWVGRDCGICPFGFSLRPTTPQVTSNLPFSTWDYRPPYLPKSWSILVATNATILTEPMLFYIPFGQRQDNYPIEQRQPLEHPVGLCNVTRVDFFSPYAQHPSPELNAMQDANLVRIHTAAEYLVELGFDEELQGQQIDFRPRLPLIFRW